MDCGFYNRFLSVVRKFFNAEPIANPLHFCYYKRIEESEKEGIAVKNLFYYAEKYLQKSTWKDMALLKFCLFSMGVLAGMAVPVKDKKKAGSIACLVFLITYIPLMGKFVRIVADKGELAED